MYIAMIQIGRMRLMNNQRMGCLFVGKWLAVNCHILGKLVVVLKLSCSVKSEGSIRQPRGFVCLIIDCRKRAKETAP